jgi:hypothetical protein
MWLRRAPEKYIAGAALDRADVESLVNNGPFLHKYLRCRKRKSDSPQTVSNISAVSLGDFCSST